MSVCLCVCLSMKFVCHAPQTKRRVANIFCFRKSLELLSVECHHQDETSCLLWFIVSSSLPLFGSSYPLTWIDATWTLPVITKVFFFFQLPQSMTDYLFTFSLKFHLRTSDSCPPLQRKRVNLPSSAGESIYVPQNTYKSFYKIRWSKNAPIIVFEKNTTFSTDRHYDVAFSTEAPGNCNLARNRLLARILFANDSVGSVMSSI